METGHVVIRGVSGTCPSFGPTYYVGAEKTTRYYGVDRANAIRAYRRATGGSPPVAELRQADANAWSFFCQQR